MRTYGRITNQDGSKTWVVVQTAANGDNSAVWLTTLCQVLLLNLNESPFYANYGIAAVPSVINQVAPDYDVNRTQQQFAPYFASLTVARQTGTVNPTYNISAMTLYGAVINATIQVPQ